MKITFSNPAQPTKGIAVVFAAERGPNGQTAAAKLDTKLKGRAEARRQGVTL